MAASKFECEDAFIEAKSVFNVTYFERDVIQADEMWFGQAHMPLSCLICAGIRPSSASELDGSVF